MTKRGMESTAFSRQINYDNRYAVPSIQQHQAAVAPVRALIPVMVIPSHESKLPEMKVYHTRGGTPCEEA